MPEPFFRFFSLSQAMAAVSIILLISSLLKINLQYFNNIFLTQFLGATCFFVPIILNFENWRSSPPLHFVLEPTGIVGPKHHNLELMTNNSQPRFLKMILVSTWGRLFLILLGLLARCEEWLCQGKLDISYKEILSPYLEVGVGWLTVTKSLKWLLKLITDRHPCGCGSPHHWP